MLLAACGAGIGVWALALGTVSLAGRPFVLDDPAGMPYAIVAGTAYLIVAVIVLTRWPKVAGAPLSSLGLRAPRGREAAVIGICVAVVCVLRLLTFAYLAAIGQSSHVQTGIGNFHPSSPGGAVLAILVGATVAPFSEELVFRGTIYRAIDQRMPDTRACIASGLIFAAARLDVVLAPFFVAYGTVLALVYRRTGNLFVPIAIRTIFDGGSYALLVWLASAR